MARLFPALETTLKWEGGYTIDTGGKTKFGISQNAYPNLDIPNLTLDAAKAIYKRDYWDRIKGDQIKDQGLANVVFDLAVNAGVGQASKMLQQAANDMGARIATDGAIGPQTLAAVNRLPGSQLANLLTKKRIEFYRGLAASNPAKYGKYLAGWLRRAGSFFLANAPAAGGSLLAVGVIGAITYYLWKRNVERIR
jgi:lysozyme family protein